jgi:hypothetical protein
MIKQAYGEEAWAVVLCLSGTKVLLVREELPKQHVTVLLHHPCSLDLEPCDFFLFPRLKEKLRGDDFCRPKRSSLPQGKPYGTFLQISFSSVSSSYTNVGRLA